MKKIIPFLFSFFFFACSDHAEKEKATNLPEIAVQLDTLVIGANTYYTQNLTDTNFSFPSVNLSGVNDSVTIAAHNDLVRRAQDSLSFKCDNGKIIKLVNNRGEENFSVFDFIGLNTEIDYYLVRHSLIEGRNFILINKKSGNPIETIGLPVVSPQKNYFACGNCDLSAAFDLNGIEIFKAGNSSYKSIGLRELTNWGPEQMTWKNDTTLIIRGLESSNDEMQNHKVYKAIFVK